MTDQKTSDFNDISTQGDSLRFVGDWVALTTELSKAKLAWRRLKRSDTVNTGSFKFDFADMDEHLEATEAHLAKHGIVVLQPWHEGPDGTDYITTVIAGHGGRIEARTRFNPAKDIKQQGGLLTYICRYAYNKTLVLGGGEDLDHNPKPVERAARKPAARRAQPDNMKAVGAPAGNAVQEEASPFDEEPSAMSPAQAKRISSLFRAMEVSDEDKATIVLEQTGTADKKLITSDGAEKLLQYLRNAQASTDGDVNA
jgi:hypothetical protein